jgi:DUF4097 and DUF4098 domain-containing protein YvlB
MKNRRQLATWLGVILGTVCALLLAAAEGRALQAHGKLTEEFHQTYPLSEGGRIELQNINGAVHIAAWDSNQVKVDAVMYANSQERLDEAKIRIDADQDTVSIRTEYRQHDLSFDSSAQNNPASVEYTLTVPRGARLDEISLINGALDLAGVGGEVHASCINGRLAANGLAGRAHLSTINGPLEVQLDRLAEPSVELSSINGSVRLTVPSDVKAELEASTVHGPISNDFGLQVHDHRWVGHHLHGELGGGGTRIKLSNVNGTIAIRHASDGRTLSSPKELDPSRDQDDSKL